MNEALKRSIFRRMHIAPGIPIVGCIYSPFDKVSQDAFPVKFVFLPLLVLTGLWLWKGHLVRRLLARDAVSSSQRTN